jgi:hypothetical protein
MDAQELMELLRKEIRAYQAKMDADGKTEKEEMLKKMRAWGEKLDEETRAILAETRAIEARTAAMRDKRLEGNMNVWQEETTACQDAMETNPRDKCVNDNHNEILACRETVEACLEERKPTSPDRKPEAAQKDEVPVDDAEVMPVGEPKKKRRRDRKLAAERRCQKPKTSTRENCGPQKRLAVARRGTSHRATVARQKGKRSDMRISRRATVARRMRDIFRSNTTRRTEVVRCKENATRKGCSRPSVVEEIRSGQAFGRRRRQKLECKKGIKSRDVEEPLHLRIGKKPANNMGGWG